MNERIMKYIPKSKRESVHDAWIDSDGMWIMLKEGWEASRMDTGCRTIHENYISDLRYQIAGITKLTEERKMKLNWQKIDHFTGEPYKRNPKSPDWHVVDYVAEDFKITDMPDGTRLLTKGDVKLGQFKTLKAAKEFAENN